MEERAACLLLKQRFEAAGFQIEENVTFDEDGLRFEMDGFDSDARVGYEYLTREMGDAWDVDADVIAQLAARRAKGDLHVLVVDENDAPNAEALEARAAHFLAEIKATIAPPEKRETKRPKVKTPPSVPVKKAKPTKAKK